MTTPTQMTDPEQRNRNIGRMTPDGLFLHQIAIDEVKDRLLEVNRTFKSILIITAAPEFWATTWPDAEILPPQDVLPIEPRQYDLVVHVLDLHWANDPVGQMIQCKRGLRPDGLFLAVTLGGQTLSELRSALAQAEIEQLGGLSPRVVPMAEIRDLGALLQRSGFALPVADTMAMTAQYRDIWHLMRDLRCMGEGNALSARLRHPTPRALFHQAGQLYQTSFPAPDGRIRATFEMIVLTGWAPAENQPKPLRPGSAAARLADALGTDETPLPD